MNETNENKEQTTDDELSAIKGYQFTPPENYYEKHDYQDERTCTGAIVMSVVGMALSFLTVFTMLSVGSFWFSLCIYPGFPLIALITSIKVLKKDKSLLAAKASLGISIASLLITVGIVIYAAVYINLQTQLIR